MAETPDPAWHGLYRAGAFAAWGYVVLGMVLPALLFAPVGYERGMDGHALLTFIADNRAWWMALQALTLGPGFLAMIVFPAVFVALRGVDRGYAAVGALLAISCQTLFVSFYPGTLGLAYLSEMYVGAGQGRREALAAAAEGVTAPLDAYNPLYETVFAAAVLILSLVMLRGVFPRTLAYLGVATAVVEVIGMSLTSVIGMGYFWWWLLAGAWFVGVGMRLHRLAEGADDAADVPAPGVQPGEGKRRPGPPRPV